MMEIVWSRGEATVREVREVLAESREIARNTVRTTLERLEEAGWLSHRLDGRTRIYRATVAKQKTLATKAVELVDRVFAGRPEDLMSALVEHRGLEPEEIDRIEALLNEARSRREQEGSK